MTDLKIGADGKIIGAADYSFFDTPKAGGDDRLMQIEKRLKGKDIILYFQTNSDKLNFTANQRKDFDDIIYYLQRKNGSNISTVGHTDNVGNASTNRRLSRKRAEFVKEYLAKNNIKSNQIKVDFKGPDQPMVPNTSDENRAKNRRVVVRLN